MTGNRSLAAALMLDVARNTLRRVRFGRTPRHGIGELEFADRDLEPPARDSYHRDRALRNRIARPDERSPFPRVASWPDLTAVQPPMVLATFHFGVLAASGALFERLPGEVFVVGSVAIPPRPGVTRIEVRGGEWERAAATMTAVEKLRSGGFVFLAVDGGGTARVEATMFGRTILLPGGAFALARIASAPILPMTTLWRGREIEIVAGEPIPPGEATAMASALVRWLEGYLRENPGALSWSIVNLLEGSL